MYKLTEPDVFDEKQNHKMNFGLYPLLPSLVTARVIIMETALLKDQKDMLSKYRQAT